jgi:hypothetical protein
MATAPRPKKTETGKGKGGKAKGGDRAWKVDEREFARWTQDMYGRDTDPVIGKLASTTGRVGHFPHLGYDMTSEHVIGESKDHKLPQWLTNAFAEANQSGDAVQLLHSLPQWLADAWAQINQCVSTRVSHRWPVLYLSYGEGQRPTFNVDNKTYPLPPMHILTPAHHKELIKGWMALQLLREYADRLENGEYTGGTLTEIAQIIKDAQ